MATNCFNSYHPVAAGRAAGVEPRRDTEQQLKILTNQVYAAMLKADTSIFEKVYVDDYIAIRGDGSVLTKAQEIEGFSWALSSTHRPICKT